MDLSKMTLKMPAKNPGDATANAWKRAVADAHARMKPAGALEWYAAGFCQLASVMEVMGTADRATEKGISPPGVMQGALKILDISMDHGDQTIRNAASALDLDIPAWLTPSEREIIIRMLGEPLGRAAYYQDLFARTPCLVPGVSSFELPATNPFSNQLTAAMKENEELHKSIKTVLEENTAVRKRVSELIGEVESLKSSPKPARKRKKPVKKVAKKR